MIRAFPVICSETAAAALSRDECQDISQSVLRRGVAYSLCHAIRLNRRTASARGIKL
jgi:hypothetical protein